MMVPADGTRTPALKELPVVFPDAKADADCFVAAHLETIITDYCLHALEHPAQEGPAALAFGVVPIAHPWFGRAFQEETPQQAWRVSGPPRTFFWVAPNAPQKANTCRLKAHDATLAALAPIALRTVEDFARRRNFATPLNEAGSLAMLQTRGTIERRYRPRRFDAGFSWDLSDPANEGFDIIVSAEPLAPPTPN